MIVGADILFTCAVATVHPETLNAIIKTESHYNPFTIAVVKGMPLKSTPKTRIEAEKEIDRLEAENANYSVGLGQINSSNFKKYGVTGKDMLNSCKNLIVAEKILKSCYDTSPNGTVAEALSCYYAGNYSFGFVREKQYNNTAYVERVIKNYQPREEFFVPSIKPEIPEALAKIRDPKPKNLAKSEKRKSVIIKPKARVFFVKNPPKNIQTEPVSSTETAKKSNDKVKLPFKF